MGRLLQLLTQVGSQTLSCTPCSPFFVLPAAMASYGHGVAHVGHVVTQHPVSQTHCDTVVETTHIEDCQDVVTQHCSSVSQQVHHSSGVVGHSSAVVAGHGHVGGYHGKREAEAEPEAEADADAEADASYGHGGHVAHSGPRCQAQTQRQCSQRPVQNSRPVSRQVCHPVSRQVCTPVEIAVPREICQTHTAVVSQAHTVVAHGHGHHGHIGGHGIGIGHGGHY